MKKKDGILLAGVLIASLLMMAVMNFSMKQQGDMVAIRRDGEIYETYPLNVDRTIELIDGDYYNRLCIKDGKAYMEDANCPDGYCVEQKEICREKETIVCLPHKLVAEILYANEKDEETIDAIAN